MSAAMTAPWYKHRWPWLLMAGPGVVVVASVVTLVLALKSNDGLVADDYYKQGLTINRVLDKEKLARDYGLSSAVVFGDGRVTVDLKSSADLPGAIRVTLTHPTRAGMDQSVLLRGIGGRYQGAFPEIPAGHWRVMLADEANSWRMSAEVQLPNQKQINIVPSELAKK